MEEYIIVEVQHLLSTRDGVWLFAGVTGDGKEVQCLVDPDRGQAILDILYADEAFPLSFRRSQVVPAGQIPVEAVG
jgi:hypothetical protein